VAEDNRHEPFKIVFTINGIPAVPNPTMARAAVINQNPGAKLLK
jgi:hypothetical protein